jgi:hypothetical protein
MLTLFTTPKPFVGHCGIIQKNALTSWKLLHPDIEVILFGNEEGAAEIAGELGLRHEPKVERDDRGNKRLDYLFRMAQKISRSELLCYVNCDILLMQDFLAAVERVKAEHAHFLMVGKRWDADITRPLDFSQPEWEPELRQFAQGKGKQRSTAWIDYFAFTRGLYGNELPGFVIGRVFWDNWLVWRARKTKGAVVDASQTVMAVHQNHDYGYHPDGERGVFYGEESGRNYELAGGWRHLRTIEDATLVLTEKGLRPNRRRHWSTMKRYLREAGRRLVCDFWQPVWFLFLGITRPVREALGLRSATMRRARGKA